MRLTKELAVKSAVLSWSSATPVNLGLLGPANDVDEPLGTETASSLNSRPFLTSGIKPTVDGYGKFTNGFAKVFTPPNLNPYFQFVTDDTNAGSGVNAGYECIKYIHPVQGLCEIEAQVSTTAGATPAPHILYLTVFINDSETNARTADKIPQKFTKTVFVSDSASAGECGVTGTFKQRVVLSANDKIKLLVYKGDSNNSSTVLCSSARLSVKTLP